MSSDPAKDDGWSLSDIGHAALDVAGLVPGYGEFADVANAAWYAGEDKYLEAGLSLISTVPLIGDAVGKGGKLATKVGGPVAEQAVKAIKALDVEKALGPFRSHPTLGPKIDKMIAAVKEWQARLLPCGKVAPKTAPTDIEAAKLIAARRKKAYEFYRRSGFTNSEAKAHMKGIDFTKEVEIVPLETGTKLTQWQVPGGPQGRYYAEAGTAPTNLGISHLGSSPGKGVVEKVSTEYASSEGTVALRSTAKGVTDKWSTHPYGSAKTKGGATQYFVPKRGAMKNGN